MRNALLMLVSLAFSLAALELGVALIVNARQLPMMLPDYDYGDLEQVKGKFWADKSEFWGVWHEPGSRFRHRKSCFDVTYSANSWGARDQERAKDAADDRVIVLGDSMVEGTGVEYGNRMTEVLEDMTSRQFLNFGIAGDFGTTQYYLLYQHLAREFSHDTVVVSVFPNNDFQDDNYEFGRRALWDRYRPYWVGEFPDYDLVYYKEALNADGQAPNITADFTLWEKVKDFLRSYTYTYNMAVYLRKYMSVSTAAERPRIYSGFYDFTKPELNRVVYSILQIQKAAEGRRVVVLILPVAPDFTRYDGRPETPLASALRPFAEDHGFELIDLLPPMYLADEGWKQYFHACDGHWNDLGHQRAAEVLAERF